MEKVNIAIIGAGIVGLAIGRELSNHWEDVIVVEQEISFGRHTSSRNSEVIHSGIYYPQKSLKAKLCVQGNQLLYQFCEENFIPYRKTGKLVVANEENETAYLNWLRENGKKNGVEDLEIIQQEKIRAIEPDIIAETALYVPSTGILDTHQCMKKMESQLELEDGFVIYDMKVVNIEFQSDKYLLHFENGEVFQANKVINSAGIFSDKVFHFLPLKRDYPELNLHWCKGEYYKTNKVSSIRHLIYPVPDPKGIFLGIHATLNLQNEIRFGPNAYYVKELSYQMDESHRNEFLLAIRHYLELNEEDIHLDDCGIRPKLQGPQDSFRDFYIQEETSKGFPNFINLIGIESPGLTASLAIGKYIQQIIQ